MADNKYTIAVDVHAVDGQSVAAYGTGSFPASAALTFSPVDGVSAVNITAITLLGTTANYSISTTVPLPLTVINTVGVGSLPFNVVFTDNTPDITGLTLAYPICANATASAGTLFAGATGTIQGITTSSNTSIVTVSGIGGWEGVGDTPRVWPSQGEFLRMHLLGYV